MTTRLDQLAREAPAEASVRFERGGPRLFLNGELTPPFFALSTSMYPTIKGFGKAGIKLFNPVVGLHWGWTGPDSYNWTNIDNFLLRLIDLHPEAYLFPRFQVDAPRWWKRTHQDQLIKYGLPYPEDRYDVIAKEGISRSEGGHFLMTSQEVWEVSFASRIWLDDTESMLRNYIRHVEASPLRSRIMGYFLAAGRTAEWNYFGADLLPDYSKPMLEACGPLPEVSDRIGTSCGLLRDPAKETGVMAFYKCLSEVVTENIMRLARAVKEETSGRVLCGTFYGYLTEAVRIQDAGYLAPVRILDCPDLDVLTCPYAYQSTNVEGEDRWKSDMEDGAGNQLGRARGVAGDGAFRAMVSSIRARGKLFISEVDPSTYLDVTASWRALGGSGSDTVEGTFKIIRRDLGKFWAEGVGGWLLDFGPLFGVETGWYGDEPLIKEIKGFAELLLDRKSMNISPVAEIAVLCDAQSFRATRHWMAEEPWHGFGIRYSDIFNHWFLNAQSRTINRVGAPVEWLHREDFLSLDKGRHKLIIVPNAFLLNREEIAEIRAFLAGSGMTVIWYYAPGFLDETAIRPGGMTDLTGFNFEILDMPGRMMIDTSDHIIDVESSFGLKDDREFYPRFSVQDTDAGTNVDADADVNSEIEVLGTWSDRKSVAFARREVDGWTSIYVGTAPIPVRWLRKLAVDAGVSLWSTRPDIISATEDTAMLVATEPGPRTFTPHKALREIRDPSAGQKDSSLSRPKHDLECEHGEVRLFTRA